MSTDERYIEEALREARAAEAEDEVPIGAVVVCRGRIIAKGHNMTERLHDPTAHAEMIAITSATEAMNWAQLGRVVYGAADPKRGYTRFSPSLLHPKTEVCSGIKENECSEIVSAFFRSKR